MITVTIPPQKYDKEKYLGHGCLCYLAEALEKAGYPGALVGGVGRTEINGRHYVTKEPFGQTTLQIAFARKESVIVTLRPS